MGAIESLSEQFGVLPSCTDSELRTAYRVLLFKTHPDRNHQDPTATIKTQDLNKAYAELKNRRKQASYGEQHGTGALHSDSSEPVFELVNVEKIAGIKTRFRASWNALRDDEDDPLRALAFVHAAFEAERGNSDIVTRLLAGPILIDLSSSLLTNSEASERDARCATLERWAEYLLGAGFVDEAIQILEDAVDSGLARQQLKEQLRSHHYRAAQYSHPTTRIRPEPEASITHLRRIVELGYNFDYVHKLLAEAYHDIGDDNVARTHLERAYDLNPDLSGAVRISRKLGRPVRARSAQYEAAVASNPRWTRPDQIPVPRQVRFWAANRDWPLVLDFSTPGDYAPRVLPAARATLRAIAASLGNSDAPTTEASLLELLNFNYYWDVAQAAAISLSKIGGEKALAALEQVRPGVTNSAQSHLKDCASYIRARLDNSNRLVSGDLVPLLSQAEESFQQHKYGNARFLLENVLLYMGNREPQFADTSRLLACACAEMKDFESAIEIIRPVYESLRDSENLGALREISDWLWNGTVFEEYYEELGSNYRWALDLSLHLISKATTPEGVLEPLRRATRWLEKLDQRMTANAIRELIRIEAPGTFAVDPHNRENYVRVVVLSDNMEHFLKTFAARIETEAAPKLQEVMRSERQIGQA